MPRTAKQDPIERLQAEAAFGRAVIDAVKEHGMVRTRRYARKAKRRTKATTNGASAPVATARKPKAKKKASKRNPLANVPTE